MNSEIGRIEHLKLIQAVIDRMGRNSFAVKSFSVGVTSALAGLATAIGEWTTVTGGVVVLPLWLLDSHFLHQERRFRSVYDAVRLGKAATPGSEEYFRMHGAHVESRILGHLKAVASFGHVLFYGTLLSAILTVAVTVALSPD